MLRHVQVRLQAFIEADLSELGEQPLSVRFGSVCLVAVVLACAPAVVLVVLILENLATQALPCRGFTETADVISHQLSALRGCPKPRRQNNMLNMLSNHTCIASLRQQENCMSPPDSLSFFEAASRGLRMGLQ